MLNQKFENEIPAIVEHDGFFTVQLMAPHTNQLSTGTKREEGNVPKPGYELWDISDKLLGPWDYKNVGDMITEARTCYERGDFFPASMPLFMAYFRFVADEPRNYGANPNLKQNDAGKQEADRFKRLFSGLKLMLSKGIVTLSRAKYESLDGETPANRQPGKVVHNIGLPIEYTDFGPLDAAGTLFRAESRSNPAAFLLAGMSYETLEYLANSTGTDQDSRTKTPRHYSQELSDGGSNGYEAMLVARIICGYNSLEIGTMPLCLPHFALGVRPHKVTNEPQV